MWAVLLLRRSLLKISTSSLELIEMPDPAGRESASNFDPYPETISIHGNRYEGGGDSPDTDYLPPLKNAAYGEDGSFPNVLWDGYVNPEKLEDSTLPEPLRICIYNEESTAVFNVDAANDFAGAHEASEPHSCEHPPLGAVTLAWAH